MQTLNAEMANGLRRERIERELRNIGIEINVLQNQKAAGAVALLDAPENDASHRALDTIDEKIANLRTRKDRLELALRRSAELEDEASIASAAAARAEQAIATCRASADRLAIACDIEKTVKRLGELLTKWGETGAAVRSDAVDAFRVAYRAKHPEASLEVVSRGIMALSPIARGDDPSMRAAMAQALFDAGLGRVGVILHDHIDIRPPLGTTLSISVAAEMAHHKMVEHLEKLGLPTTAKSAK